MEIALSIIAIALSVVSGLLSCYAFIWTAKRDRKQATLEAYNRLQSEVFDNLNKYPPKEIADICNDTKSIDYKTISGYLARIEHFCVGINEGIYDKNTFYALAHGYFDGYQIRKRIEPIISSKNIRNTNQKMFYNDTVEVLLWMDKKSGNHTHEAN